MQWSLNKAQKLILIISLVLIALSFLFPCWEFKLSNERVLKRIDYQFIFTPPMYPTGPNSSRPMEIDYGRMLIQIVVVIIVGGGLIVFKKS